MKLKIDILDGGKKIDKWLSNVSRKDMTSSANKYGRDLTASLKRFTPVDTGEMANSWNHKVSKSGRGIYDISITNDSHSDKKENIPLLVNNGHGLRGGGYVKANPFIKKALNAVYDECTSRILEELLNGR